MNRPFDPSSASGGTTPTPRLSPDDIRVLDLLAEQGFDPAALDRLSGPDRARGEALLRMLRLLEDCPVSDGDESLVDATLARIARAAPVGLRLAAEPREPAIASVTGGIAGWIDPGEGATGSAGSWRPRWADLLTLAAVCFLAFGTFAPMISRMRGAAIEGACAENLHQLGESLALYSIDHGGMLPSVRAGLPSWERGRNSENLDLLPAQDYCSQGHLNCPGHGGAGSSYSYRVMGSDVSRRLAVKPELAVLSDRNPVIDHALRGVRVANLALPSPNHEGRGQQVLFGHLSVKWTSAPIVLGVRGQEDNLWLMRNAKGGEDLLRGMELMEDDNFLSQ